MTHLTFSRITSTNDLTKRFALDKGQIDKTSAAQVTQGTIETVTVEGLEGLRHTIGTLTARQALMFGILANGGMRAQVVTQAQLEDARRTAVDPNAIVARTREFFNFPYQPGVLMGPLPDSASARQPDVKPLVSSPPETRWRWAPGCRIPDRRAHV